MDACQWMERSIKAIEAMAPVAVDWLPWGMSKSEWAAWIQAVGSLLGIGIAIAVPAWLRIEERGVKIAETLDRAELAAHQVLSSIRMITPGMRSLYKRSLEDKSGDFSGQIKDLFKESMSNSVRPTEDQLLRLLPVAGGPAYKVAEAFGWMERLYFIFSFDEVDADTVNSLVKQSLPKLKSYEILLEKASMDMIAFIESRKISTKVEVSKKRSLLGRVFK